jgi:DNA-binding NarL/FixJ family response regulator
MDDRDQAADGEIITRQFRENPGVLVVDDDHLVRAGLQLGLALNGFTVWSAADGCEALHLYREHTDRIVVVLVDFRVPGLDAFATLDVLHQLNPELRICFMSSDARGCDPQALLRRGVSQVIGKPFHVSDVVGILRPLVCGAPAGPPQQARRVSSEPRKNVEIGGGARQL